MQNKNTKKCVDVIADFLEKKGIKTVFDLSGGMIVFLEDAISKKEGMNCFPMHHEQAAAFAAEGYARKTQNFGVAISTSGPGALNMVNPIGSCYFDSIPAMFITGNVNTKNIRKSEGIRQEGFQETDIVSVAKPITKYAVMVTDPNNIIYELEKAYYIMKEGRPGSVLIDIPINNQYAEIDIDSAPHFIDSEEFFELNNKTKISEIKWSQKIEDLKKYLANSKKPIALVGNGVRVSDSVENFKDFIQRNNLPVVTSLLGLDVYSDSNNLVGYIGSNGNRDANIILANADLIIVFGARLDVRQTGGKESFNSDAVIVHIDIDNNVIDYSIKSTLSFNVSLPEFFSKTKEITNEKNDKWFSFIKDIKNEFGRNDNYAENFIDPNTFIKELSLSAPKNAIMVADVGQNQIWCAQSWMTKDEQRVIFSGGMGSMGFSLPASIGASVASPDSLVISINGDGGFQMNLQEMETISRNKLPIKIFVLNNSSLGMVREFQDLYLNSNYQSTVVGYGCPDLNRIATAFDFEYFKLEKITKNEEKFNEIFNNDKPTLVEVIIDIKAPLEPKVVFGHKLDDQSPYLNDEKINKLKSLKDILNN